MMETIGQSTGVSISLLVTVVSGAVLVYSWGFKFLFDCVKSVKDDTEKLEVGLKSTIVLESSEIWRELNKTKEVLSSHQLGCLTTFAKNEDIRSLKHDLDTRLGRMETMLTEILKKGLN
jgi:hypothetical protein